MANYYCLVTGLPDLSLEDGKLSYTVANFRTEIYPQLTAKDQKIIDLFYLKFDNQNFLTLLKDKDASIDVLGNYSAAELLGIISSINEETAPKSKYPAYFYQFAELFLSKSHEERGGMDDVLQSYYYDYAMKCSNSVVSSWFEYNLNINNIFSALLARKYQMEVSNYIVGTNSVADQLRHSNARDFGISSELTYFESLVRISEHNDLVDREKKLDLLKWNWLEDTTFFHYFSIEKIFVFLSKIDMIERWISLDKDKGNEMFRKLIQQLKDEVQIPEEFRK